MPVFNTFFSVGKVCDFHYDCETVGDVSDEEDLVHLSKHAATSFAAKIQQSKQSL